MRLSFDCVKNSVKRKRVRMLILLFVLIVAFVVWLYVTNVIITVTDYTVTLSPEYAELDGLVIVQVADLHNREYSDNGDRLVELVAKAQPDMVVFTGDTIDSRSTDIDRAMYVVEGIADMFRAQGAETLPMYLVSGNHEARMPEKFSIFKERLKNAGVTVLEDESVIYTKGEQTVQVVGLCDPDFRVGDDYSTTATALTELVDDEMFTLCLSHRPELYTAYMSSGAELTLCGHAHGGQVRIPFVGAVLAPNQGFFPEYAEGMFSDGGSAMIVSRGIGNSVVPVRVNNPSEVVRVTLRG